MVATNSDALKLAQEFHSQRNQHIGVLRGALEGKVDVETLAQIAAQDFINSAKEASIPEQDYLQDAQALTQSKDYEFLKSRVEAGRAFYNKKLTSLFTENLESILKQTSPDDLKLLENLVVSVKPGSGEKTNYLEATKYHGETYANTQLLQKFQTSAKEEDEKGIKDATDGMVKILKSYFEKLYLKDEKSKKEFKGIVDALVKLYSGNPQLAAQRFSSYAAKSEKKFRELTKDKFRDYISTTLPSDSARDLYGQIFLYNAQKKREKELSSLEKY